MALLLLAPRWLHPAPRRKLCGLSLHTRTWTTAQGTCTGPGMLRDLSTGGSHSEVQKKCFTTACNASKEGRKLFRTNHAFHNVQLSLPLLYVCTQPFKGQPEQQTCVRTLCYRAPSPRWNTTTPRFQITNDSKTSGGKQTQTLRELLPSRLPSGIRRPPQAAPPRTHTRFSI